MSLFNLSKEKQIRLLLLFPALLIFSYTVYRAAVMSFTWDESFTYLQFVLTNIVMPDTYGTMSANNHLLNSLLMQWCVSIFGSSDFILRLPNLAAHLLFLGYSAALVRNFENKALVITSFLIINLQPYMLDFFSLARGYGLSLGLMMASIYYLHGLQNRKKQLLYAAISVLFAALAVLANMVLLNYLLILLFVLVLFFLHQAATSNQTIKQKLGFITKHLLTPMLLTGLLLLFVMPIAFKLKDAGALFFGANANFWKSTIVTIVDKCFYELDYSNWFHRAAKGFVIILIAAATMYACFRFLKRQVSPGLLFLTSLLLLIILCAVSTIVQHYLLGTLYLTDRTALFLLVLFNLLFVFFINELSKGKYMFAGIAYVSSLGVLIHFVMAFNLHYVIEWKFDSDTKAMLNDLEDIKTIPEEKGTVNIGMPFLFEQTSNYYKASTIDLKWLNASTNLNMLNDYFYLDPETYSEINPDSLRIIKTYPLTKNILAEPKYKPFGHKITYQTTMHFDTLPEKKFSFTSAVEFGPSITYKINDSAGQDKKAMVIFETLVAAPDINKSNVSIVITFQNEKGCYFWKSVNSRHFIQKTGEWAPIRFSCVAPSETQSGDELKVYIWNSNKQMLDVSEMSIKWIEYIYKK